MGIYNVRDSFGKTFCEFQTLTDSWIFYWGDCNLELPDKHGMLVESILCDFKG